MSSSTLNILILLTITLLGSQRAFAQDANSEHMHDLYTTLINAILYPNNVEQAQMIKSTLFADNVKGRVDLTRSFEGSELNTESLFGFFSAIATNTSFSLLLLPVAYEERGFVSSGNLAATSSLITFRHLTTGIELPMVVDLWFRVNDEDKVTEYDASFKRANWYFQTFYEMVTPIIAADRNIPLESINATSFEGILKDIVVESLCKIHEDHCTGDNKQYDSYEDCANFITSLPMGDTYAFGHNTASCRMLHQEMVPVKPETFCSHIGKSSDGLCVDRNFTDASNEKLFDPLLIEDESA